MSLSIDQRKALDRITGNSHGLNARLTSDQHRAHLSNVQAELDRERESHNLTRWYMAIGFAVLVGIVVWQALKIRGCA